MTTNNEKYKEGMNANLRKLIDVHKKLRNDSAGKKVKLSIFKNPDIYKACKTIFGDDYFKLENDEYFYLSIEEARYAMAAVRNAGKHEANKIVGMFNNNLKD